MKLKSDRHFVNQFSDSFLVLYREFVKRSKFTASLTRAAIFYAQRPLINLAKYSAKRGGRDRLDRQFWIGKN